MRLARIVALVFVLASCEAIAPWLARNPSCAEWQKMSEGDRSAVAAEIVRAHGWVEAVRRGQQADGSATPDELFRMAAHSVTKNCDINGWDANVRAIETVHAIYGRYAEFD